MIFHCLIKSKNNFNNLKERHTNYRSKTTIGLIDDLGKKSRQVVF